MHHNPPPSRRSPNKFLRPAYPHDFFPPKPEKLLLRPLQNPFSLFQTADTPPPANRENLAPTLPTGRSPANLPDASARPLLPPPSSPPPHPEPNGTPPRWPASMPHTPPNSPPSARSTKTPPLIPAGDPLRWFHPAPANQSPRTNLPLLAGIHLEAPPAKPAVPFVNFSIRIRKSFPAPAPPLAPGPTPNLPNLPAGPRSFRTPALSKAHGSPVHTR